MSENKYPIGGYAPLKQLLGDLIECVINDRLVFGATPNGRPHDPDPEIDRLRIEILSLYGNRPAGAVWVKGDYDRLYEQVKSGKRVVCYVDYNYPVHPQPEPMRDICTIGATMEFVSRGRGYATAKYMPGDEKVNFVGLCEEMNVEWLDESGTAPNEDDEWIDVNDRLPDEGGRYWCYVEEITDLGRGYFQWNCAYNQNCKFFTDKSLCNGERITHWQPLPAPPKFKQSKIK